MDSSYLLEKIKRGEGLKIEFKESVEQLPKSFYETVVSFSNTDGGIIILGVDDDKNIIGVNESATKQIVADIVSSLSSNDCISPTIFIIPSVVDVCGKSVIAMQIPSSSSVHKDKGLIYKRAGDVDVDITDNTELVEALNFEKSNRFTESTIYPHLTMDDLDVNLFVKAKTLIRNNRSDHPWLLIDNEQMLRESTLWRKDYKSGEEGLTLAAALIFGKDTTIQSLLPAYKVEAMTRIENLDRWDDRLTKRTNLIDTYLDLKEFINKHLSEKFYLEGDQRVDLRDKIFREVIGNIVVHREYSNPLSTDLIIYSDYLYITNPNKPLFHGVLDPNSFNPYPKNPNIRKFFTALGWTDEIGSGVRNTNKYLPLYANGAKPIFTEDTTFKTEIPLHNITLAKYFEQWSRWLELEVDMTDYFKRSLENITLSRGLRYLSWEDLILKILPSWNKKATQLRNISWPNNQVVTENEIKKLPSWSEKATQLLRIKVRYYIIILSLCSEPMGIKEILKAIGYNDESGFKNKYIKPLRESGLLDLTNPDKPTSPLNKYILTEQGKSFLVDDL